jgi:hypothetical protein
MSVLVVLTKKRLKKKKNHICTELIFDGWTHLWCVNNSSRANKEMIWTSWLCSGRRTSAVEQPRSDNTVLSAVMHQQNQITALVERARQYSDAVETQLQEQQLMQQQHVADTRAADGEQVQQLQDLLAVAQECAVRLGDQCVALLPCRHVCRAREQQHTFCPVCLDIVNSSHEVEFGAIESVPKF